MIISNNNHKQKTGVNIMKQIQLSESTKDSLSEIVGMVIDEIESKGNRSGDNEELDHYYR